MGSASARLAPDILGMLLSAAPWYVATDADSAGDKAAVRWLDSARCRRVRPPGPYKDWTEAKADGVDLRRWWGDVLGGIDRPALFTWDDLAGWRWGPAHDDPTPGIVIDRTDEARMRTAPDRPDNRVDKFAAASLKVTIGH